MNYAEGFGQFTTGGLNGEIKEISSLADSGPGTLRNILEQATKPTVIIPQPKLTGTISLGETIYVPKDVTLDGKYQLTINKNGFVSAQGNNIYTSLFFRDICGPDDSIRIGHPSNPPVEKVVIDHCHFTNPSYGQLTPEPDEYISAIYGANEITVSWCSFVYGNKGLLLGNGDAPREIDCNITMTMHHNYFHHLSRRHPYLRYGKVDMYNNWINCWDYRTSSYEDGEAFGAWVRDYGQLLLESNVIEQDRWLFKYGGIIANIRSGGYGLKKGAFCTHYGMIESINNLQNHWWLLIENNAKVFKRPYAAGIHNVYQVKQILMQNLPEQVRSYL